MKIILALKKFGLSESSTKVYLAALQVGSGSIQDIARQAQLPRTTTHEIIQQLIQRGFVSYVNRGRSRTYTVESPLRILAIARERERDLLSVMPELLSLYKTEGKRPTVRFFDGEMGIRNVFEDTLTAEEKTLRAIVSMEDLYALPGKEFMRTYIKERVQKGYTLHVIRSKSKELEKTWPGSREERRELRYAPDDLIFPMTVYVYDNKVGIIGTQQEPFGMIIVSVDLARTFKNLFSVLWQVSSSAY